ncbi:uncharacterized protein NEMAJ01_0713 [Nematocida major]|uniref:uncharacterized protein n=1 Tax=Nematocida major TaxID=1912982 RepID=UPI0020086AD4|nr:uncharacterized protein NEMAJ01_0713 [Nematocida major]KAH9385817.1 hypothetical protein NEMAJ01_0713 [Nematocida major]
MNTEKSATLKINVEKILENYKQNAICEVDKVLAPVPTINWPSFLSKIFIGSTHMEFPEEAEENWKNKIQVLSRILEMNTICFIMQSKGKCALDFRNAVLGDEMDDELTGRAALEKCAEKCEFIRRNLTEDKIDGEPTIKAFMEAETAKMIHVIEYISKFSESDAKNYIEHLINITTRRFSLLALTRDHCDYSLDSFCSRYEQKNSISSSDNIYSLEELYTLEKDGKLLLDEVLEETFGIIYRDYRYVSVFRTVKEMEAMDISPETMKRIRSINHHNRAIVFEQEFVYQMLYMERSLADLERNAKILDGILDVKKSNPIGADIFRKSVDPVLISFILCKYKDKKALLKRLIERENDLKKKTREILGKLDSLEHGTEEAMELNEQIEFYKLLKTTTTEVLNLFQNYRGLALVQRKAIWAKIESYSRNLQVKIKDFDLLRKSMMRYEEDDCFYWDLSSDDDEVEDDVKDEVEEAPESNRPFDQSASHLNNNSAPVNEPAVIPATVETAPVNEPAVIPATVETDPVNIQQEATPVIVETVPVNPEDIEYKNSKIENLLQVLLCLFFSLFIVSSSMAIYEEIQSQA